MAVVRPIRGNYHLFHETPSISTVNRERRCCCGRLIAKATGLRYSAHSTWTCRRNSGSLKDCDWSLCSGLHLNCALRLLGLRLLHRARRLRARRVQTRHL
jgi:hypothetical protein